MTETLSRLAEGGLKPAPQDESQATCIYKLSKKLRGEVRWQAAARQIVDLVRGVNPWPGAYTYHRGQLLKVWEAALAELEADGAKPGTILAVNRDSIIVACGTGSMSLNLVQPPNRPRRCGRVYANGYPG